MAREMRWFAEQGMVNIMGGCCGTTPAHIRAIAEVAKSAAPHKPAPRPEATILSGLEPLTVSPEVNFVNVGERCNVAGSRKFLRLIKEKNYDEALTIAREQIEAGAQIIDINMDDGMLDTRAEMVHFLNLIASEPDVCRVPVMIDSSRWEVIEAGLKCIQGKSIVNSISLKEGEEAFLERAAKIRELGAAVVVMAFDVAGEADTYERRVDICNRAYRLLVDRVGFNPYDIIFDPNILAIATGIAAHDNYAVDFIRTTAWIKANLPGAKVSGGVSNLSFALRGNNYIREAMHAVFLYHAIRAGMDMGIVNPASSVVYEDIPADMLEVVEDVVLNRRPDATERLITFVHEYNERATAATATGEAKPAAEAKPLSVGERLVEALRRGNGDHLDADLDEALRVYPSPLAIISGPLMEGMDLVGRLFGEGKMFLPQIVKTARTMKRAVEILRPHIEASQGAGSEAQVAKAGRVLIATVKGDVHDIGKNIVGVILGCNNFEVIDLGVMVPAEEIVRQAIAHKVDVIGLSGLITPSLEEMARVAAALEEAGLTIPLFVGGATTSAIHTAVKIAPHYGGPVFHLRDAARNPLLAAQLLNPVERDEVIARLREEQAQLRAEAGIKEPELTNQEAVARRLQLDWSAYEVPRPSYTGVRTVEIPVAAVRPLINWTYFLHAWKLEGFARVADIEGCDHCRAAWLASVPEKDRAKAAEAMQIIKEANRIIDRLDRDGFKLLARVGFFEAKGTAEEIIAGGIAIPTPRSHRPDAEGRCKALCDYIAPQDDYLGAFVATVGEAFMDDVRQAQREGDDYRALLMQSVGDRLAEAASEWLHREVRTSLWGYAADEQLSPADIKRGHYRGIRPAVGYPSLPDQRLAFTLDRLLHFGEIGVGLTCNGAMTPPASVCGLYFAHPEARYFIV
jgi:5-methyltetrahydrofolate--homocysteine methyltransferase